MYRRKWIFPLGINIHVADNSVKSSMSLTVTRRNGVQNLEILCGRHMLMDPYSTIQYVGYFILPTLMVFSGRLSSAASSHLFGLEM